MIIEKRKERKMEGILKQTVKDFSKASQYIQTIVIALLALLVPTFLAQLLNLIFGAESMIASNSQLIVGSVVNIMLVMSALNLKGWTKIAFVITMPSISTILSGYVFKSASVYMVYMIPAIWLGNLALILAFKYIMIAKKKNYFISSVIGIVSKVAIIFGFFSILRAFNLFPDKLISNLQNAMSITQFVTASIGCLLAFGIYRLEKVKRNNERVY